MLIPLDLAILIEAFSPELEGVQKYGPMIQRRAGSAGSYWRTAAALTAK
jgi:hypothetical protein